VISNDLIHLDAETVAAYSDSRLDAAERVRVEAHLVACAECRAEVVAVGQLLRSYRPAVRRFPVPLQLAAAAVLLVAIGVPIGRRLRAAPELPPVRHAPTGTAAGLAIVTPAPDTVLAASARPEFTWHAAEPGSTFRLTVVDESGATIWSVETGDTTVFLPQTVVLKTGGTFFWYVDAMAATGRSMTSGARRFTVR